MRHFIVILALGVAIAGCGKKQDPGQETSPGKYSDSLIMRSLLSRHRNSVNIAFMTLSSEKVFWGRPDLGRDYHVVEPMILKAQAAVMRLDASGVKRLDEAYKKIRSYYSPFWYKPGGGWKE
ncbi:hypothetical protein KKF84_10155 [Myxococcota bacterium]|nr:hypothetical protein [Myxococcota bacterium]MBU1535674.1 hypothetical protein [Myxococcota bacterium]